MVIFNRGMYIVMYFKNLKKKKLYSFLKKLLMDFDRLQNNQQFEHSVKSSFGLNITLERQYFPHMNLHR